MWRQFHLVTDVGHRTGIGPHRSTQQLRCWLRDDPRLQVGARISLKREDEPESPWMIDERSEMTLNRPPTKEWKVGGLS